MSLNLSSAPYFDDYSEGKDFHKILFKPGISVQTRELTQLQTILQKQIERFGNHIFQHGSMVVPGATLADLYVPYAKLNSQTSGNTKLKDTFAEGDIVVGLTNGVRAIVKHYVEETSADPKTVYFSYLSGGTTASVPNGVNYFVEGEVIQLESSISVKATIQIGAGSIGLGSIAQITDGVYYVNGMFVAVHKQIIDIDKYTSSPTCRVGLKIVESIVTSIEDISLLDNAQGSNNYAAPGADRLKVSLVLTKYDYADTTTDNYVELMRYNAGVLEEHVRFAKYSELDKTLAKRTFEESGNYRVSGFNLKVNEHKKTVVSSTTLPNGGIYLDGDIGSFVLSISPGKAYINGFSIDRLADTKFTYAKARGDANTNYQSNVSIRPNFGQYLYVADVNGPINYSTRPTLRLYGKSTFTAGVSILGTCKAYTIDHHYGTGTDRIFIIGIYDITLNAGVVMGDIGGFDVLATPTITGKVCQRLDISNPLKNFTPGEVVTYTPSAGTASATVEVFDRSSLSLYVFRHGTDVVPTRGSLIVGGTSAATATINNSFSSLTFSNTPPIFALPFEKVRRVKNSSNASTIQYSVWRTISITTNASGNGSAAVNSNETILAIDVGTFTAFGSSGILSNSLFSLTGTQTLNIAGGPVSSTVIATLVVVKTDAQERTKTLTYITDETTASVSGVNPIVALAHSDIYEVTKVMFGANDVTNLVKIDDGNRDFSYNNGSVKYPGTITTPVTVKVTYSYFAHSSTGDYFSVDSYAGTFGADVHDKIVNYTSSNGDIYDLRNCLDFRSSGTTSAMVVNDYVLSTSVQNFVGNYISVYLDTKGPKAVLGASATKPVAPKVPNDVLKIGTIYVPPYTTSVSDIVISEDDNYRFTMKDIASINRRVSTLEYFSALSLKEKGLVDFNIVDAATGLNRFKTGLAVEEFKDQLNSADMTNPGNTVSYEVNGITASLTNDQNLVSVYGSTGTTTSVNYSYVGDVAMLAYTEETWTAQPVSSTLENLNPYKVFSWRGVMELVPSYDALVEQTNIPAITAPSTGNVVVGPTASIVVAGPTEAPKTSGVVIGPTSPAGSTAWVEVPVIDSGVSTGIQGGGNAVVAGPTEVYKYGTDGSMIMTGAGGTYGSTTEGHWEYSPGANIPHWVAN